MKSDKQMYRTMKQKIVFLIGMVLCLAEVNAQNEETIPSQKVSRDSIKVITSLKKEIASKDKMIEKLNTEVERLKADNERLDSTLRAEIREGKANKFKQQIKQLKQDSLNLSNQLTTVMEDARKADKKQADTLTELFKKDSLTIVSLQDKLNELQNFRVKWLAQLAESVDKKWLSKPFSAIDVNELETDFQQYEEFSSADKKVADARDKLKVFLNNCQLYQKAVKAVNSMYNPEIINSLITPIRTLRDSITNTSSKEDIKIVYWQLNNYEITIEIFQEVIQKVNKAVNGQSTHKAAWPLANATLDKQEKESEYISAIQMIPWLAKQYADYFKGLEEDCLKPNPIGEMIMNIKL